MMNRNGSAGPSLNFRAEMLRTANLDWFRFRHCCADGIGTDIGFAPTSSIFHMAGATGVNNPGVSLCIDDQSGGIGQNHHGIGIAQECSRTLERGACGVAEQGVLGTVTIQLGFRYERRPCAIDRDPMVFGSLPRCSDRQSQIRRQGSALDEFFPGHPHFSLVHPGSSEVTTSATRVSTGLLSITLMWVACQNNRLHHAKSARI